MSLWTAKAHELDIAQAKQLADLAREADQPLEQRYATTLAGDTRKLRGIPAIGRGVTGAIPGTRPGDTLTIRAVRPAELPSTPVQRAATAPCSEATPPAQPPTR